MADQVAKFSTAKLPAFRYLLATCRPASERTASILLNGLFASPRAVLPGMLNSVLLNTIALILHAGRVFVLFLALEIILALGRILVFRRLHDNAAKGMHTAADPYVMVAISWCALQGSLAFFAMRSGIAPLQIITAMSTIGLVGPLCARCYGAPRFAMALITLTQGPMVLGVVFSGSLWMLLLLLQVPGFLFGVTIIINRLQISTIAALAAEEDSSDRAQRDALTGLLNRFGFMTALEKQDWTSEEGIFFYLDLDGFKLVNDTYGHEAGDKLLRAVAKRLTASARPGDIISRLGGDEFVIMTTGLTPEDGENYARRIISQVADQPYLIKDTEPLRIGISIGSACSPEDGTAGDDLKRKADAALYEAKAAGKGVYRRFKTLSSQHMTATCRIAAI